MKINKNTTHAYNCYEKYSKQYNMSNWWKKTTTTSTNPVFFLKHIDDAFQAHLCLYLLNSCPQGFKPVFYRRYVDDIFVLFKSNDHLKYFQEFLNSCHINMSFSMETERQNKFSFLDIEVTHKQDKFSTTIYRKPTFTGVYSNFL